MLTLFHGGQNNSRQGGGLRTVVAGQDVPRPAVVYLGTVGEDVRVNTGRQPLPPVYPDELVPRHVPRQPLADDVGRGVGRSHRLE